MGQDLPATVRTVQQRLDVLTALDGTALAMRDLEGRLDASRSTLTRAVRDLEDAGFVERADDGYRATLAGTLAARASREYIETVTDIAEMEAALASIDSTAPLTPSVVAGGDAYIAEPPHTYRPREPLETAVRTATRVRSLNVAIPSPKLVSLTAERVLSGDLAAETVFTPAVVETLATDFADVMAELAACEGYTALETEDVPLALLVTDHAEGDGEADGTRTDVFVLAAESTGNIAAVIHNDTPAAVRWAEDLFATVTADARDVTARFADATDD